jgi:hypothetical protein
MSTLKVDTLQTTGGAGLYPAKAWVNFNGSGTIAIRRDGNVSSLTDYGTGNYGFSFSNNLSAGNYGVGGVAGYFATVGTRGDVNLDVPSGGLTSSLCRVLTTQNAFYDCDLVSVRCTE